MAKETMTERFALFVLFLCHMLRNGKATITLTTTTPVVENGIATLTCYVTPPSLRLVEIDWFLVSSNRHNSKHIYTTSYGIPHVTPFGQYSGRVSKNESTSHVSLIMKSTVMCDSGTYRCSVNEIGELPKTADLDLNVAEIVQQPKILLGDGSAVPNDPVKGKVKEPFSYKCVMRANPEPNIQWMKIEFGETVEKPLSGTFEVESPLESTNESDCSYTVSRMLTITPAREEIETKRVSYVCNIIGDFGTPVVAPSVEFVFPENMSSAAVYFKTSLFTALLAVTFHLICLNSNLCHHKPSDTFQ